MLAQSLGKDIPQFKDAHTIQTKPDSEPVTASDTNNHATPAEEYKTRRKNSQLMASIFINEVQKRAKNRRATTITKSP